MSHACTSSSFAPRYTSSVGRPRAVSAIRAVLKCVSCLRVARLPSASLAEVVVRNSSDGRVRLWYVVRYWWWPTGSRATATSPCGVVDPSEV